MKHFEDKDLIDFVRDTANPKSRREIQSHLDGNCADCELRLRLWKWMKEFGIQEARNRSAADTVRIAKAAFHPVSAKSRGAMRNLAILVFDSFAQLQVTGVRSTASGARQLLYRAGPLTIDMKLQMPSTTGRFSLVGQVMSSDDNSMGMNEVPVHLLSGTSELASTSTNQFGEFYLEHDNGKDLQVALEVSREKEVFIPLDEVIWRTAFGRQS
jgi:hypothetical protein